MPVRKAKAEDLDALLGLYKDLHANDEALPERGAVEKVWSEILAAPRHFVLVLEQEQALIASCVLQVVPNLTRGAKPYGLIENVVTRQDRRGQGHGSELMKHALERAWQEGCYKVMLLTGQPKVVEFYEKVGFKRDVKTGLVAKAPRSLL
jgi:N-acetylglutamate synthase-like GNAT family acetyltransferase